MESPPNTPQPSPEKSAPKLTEQDLQDREDFQYLLLIMEKQGSVGVTQPSDYEDAISYRDKLESFREGKALEGSVTILFDDVIFDFDGVLYDSTYSTYRALELMLEKGADKNIPSPNTIPEIANSYQAPFQNYYKRFGTSLETPEDIVAFRDAYRDVVIQVNNEHHAPADLYPEVKNVLDKIKEAKKENSSLRIHIISAGSEKHIKDVLEKHGIIDDFDEIHAESHDKTAMIKTVADRAKVKDRTVMVGDLPSDIKNARQVAGVKTIAVARGTSEHEHLGMYLPDYIVTDLTGLFDLKSYSRELREKEYDKENPFTDPKVGEQWASSVEGEKGLWRDQTLYPAMKAWLENFNQGNAVVVDIGSGQGRSSIELDGYGKYIGVEPSAFLTERARTLYPSENRDFIVGNAYEIPLADNSVDGAISINVWFHLADLEKASQELSRILKSGGAFFINTADNDSLETWKSFYVNPEIDDKKMQGEVKVPVNNMTLNTFYFQPNEKVIEILRKHGLEVTKVTKSLEIDGETLFVMIEGKKI